MFEVDAVEVVHVGLLGSCSLVRDRKPCKACNIKLSRYDVSDMNLENLFYARTWIRAMLCAVLVGGTPAYLLSLLWSPLLYVAMVLCPPVFVFALFVFCTGPMRCPQCRSRLNDGAVRCSRCGQAW